MFCDVFPSKEVEVLFISFEIKLVELYQRFNELLSIYYKRIYNFMKGVSVKNRSISTLTFLKFSFLELIFLNIVFRAFIRGLIDHEIHKKVIRGIT